MERDERQGVESIETGGRLLQALAVAPGAMMLRHLAQASGMPAAKAHRYLVSLMRLGLVEQQPGGRYDLGPFAIQLGLAALGRLDPLQVALDALEVLRDRIGHTVALAVPGTHGPTIVRWLDSNAPVSASLRTGAVMPLTRSATGRVFLAFDPAAIAVPQGRWASMLAAELAQNARRGLVPVDADGVRALAAECTRRGLARVTGDLVPGIHSVSAPVFDAQGQLVLAVTALGYEGLFDADWDGDLARGVRECARGISQRLGAAES